MTRDRHRITELDLLAYADGLLDRDPARRAQAEAYLEARPEEARRISDYARQNEAIRRAYDTTLEAPVPERLYAVLEARPRASRHGWMSSAAVLGAVAVCAGLAGWWLGKGDPGAGPQRRAFVERAVLGHSVSPAQPPPGMRAARNGAAEPLDWLTERVPVKITLPDLSAHGYTMTGKRILSTDGQRLVQVVYTGIEGRRLSLFLQPRWQEDSPQMRFARNDDVTVAYWADGPFVYGLAGSAARSELAALAASVRDAMQNRTGPAQGGTGPGLTAPSQRAPRLGDQEAAVAKPEEALGLTPAPASDL